VYYFLPFTYSTRLAFKKHLFSEDKRIQGAHNLLKKRQLLIQRFPQGYKAH
jgi:hypothetical protein